VVQWYQLLAHVWLPDAVGCLCLLCFKHPLSTLLANSLEPAIVLTEDIF